MVNHFKNFAMQISNISRYDLSFFCQVFVFRGIAKTGQSNFAQENHLFEHET